MEQKEQRFNEIINLSRSPSRVLTGIVARLFQENSFVPPSIESISISDDKTTLRFTVGAVPHVEKLDTSVETTHFNVIYDQKGIPLLEVVVDDEPFLMLGVQLPAGEIPLVCQNLNALLDYAREGEPVFQYELDIAELKANSVKAQLTGATAQHPVLEEA